MRRFVIECSKKDFYTSHSGLALIGLAISREAFPLAKRRRIKTVIQELMYLAARLVTTGRRLKILFSRHCPAFGAFGAVYNPLACG